MVAFAGRSWIVSCSPRPSFQRASEHAVLWLLAATGTLLSLVLFGATLLLVQGRTRAVDRQRVLENVVERSPAVAYVVRPEEGWPLEFISENVAAFGYTAAEMLRGDFPYPTLIHPDDRDAMIAYLEDEVVAMRGPFHREYRIRRGNDGEQRWVYGLGTVYYDADGTPATMAGTIQDITERRLAETSLRESEDRYRTLVEQQGEGLGVVDANAVSYTHLRAHETVLDLVCRLLLEKKK